jgi:hypothetical protein
VSDTLLLAEASDEEEFFPPGRQVTYEEDTSASIPDRNIKQKRSMHGKLAYVVFSGCNVEVPRLATYICDEDLYLRAKEAELTPANPALAHQVSIHWMERGRFNAHHLKVLGKIHLLPGYTGRIDFGTHIAEPPTVATEPPGLVPALPQAVNDATPGFEDLEEDLEEEQAGEDEDVAVLGAFFSVINMSFDGQ